MGMMDNLKSKLGDQGGNKQRLEQIKQQAREKGWDDKLRQEYRKLTGQQPDSGQAGNKQQ
jgi:hypothetical protein